MKGKPPTSINTNGRQGTRQTGAATHGVGGTQDTLPNKHGRRDHWATRQVERAKSRDHLPEPPVILQHQTFSIKHRPSMSCGAGQDDSAKHEPLLTSICVRILSLP